MAAKAARYYLVSPAGIPNYGDELIAATWLRYLAEAAPDAEVVVDCLGAPAAREALGHLHPRASFVSVLWQLCTGNWSADPRTTADAVTRAVRDPATAPRHEAGIGLLRGADVVHVVGGGFVNGIWSPFVGLYAGVAAAAEAGARAVATGQGLWPPPGEAAQLLRSLVAGFDVVDVRDVPSADFLAGGPDAVSRTGDDVFLDLGPRLYRGGDLTEVMVSVQSLLSEVEPEPLVRSVADVLKEWQVAEVGLLECAPDQDREVLAMAERILPVSRVYRQAEVLADGFPAAAGQTWITTRFHPHLMAAAAGASGVALSIQPEYYATKHRSLTEGGSGWQVVSNLEGLRRPEAGGYDDAAVAALRAGKRELAARIYGTA